MSTDSEEHDLPIYEYRCASCRRKSTFLTRSVYTEVEAVCARCGSRDMSRLISTVSFKKSSRNKSSGHDGEMDYYRDPSNIGRHVEDSFERFGVDMPESVRETIDDARRGKMPEGLDI